MSKFILSAVLLICFWSLEAQVEITINHYDTLNIENNNDYSTFTKFDDYLEGKKVFLIGENHQYRHSNSKLQLKMLKYLNTYAGVNNWVMEFGFSRAFLINNYINNVEDSVFIEQLERYSYSEYMELYKNVREYNLSLPEESRITVHGLDVERNLKLPVSLLVSILPEKQTPKDIIVNIEALKGLAKYYDIKQDESKEIFNREKSIDFNGFNSSRYFSGDKTIKSFIEKFDENDSIYKEYLEDNYSVFAKVIDEIRSYLEYSSYSSQTHQYAFRENYIYYNFEDAFLKDTTQKFFGQFGRCHVVKLLQDEACSWYDYVSFAAKVFKSNQIPVNSIMTLGIVYPKYSGLDQTLKNDDELKSLIESFPKEGNYSLNLNKFEDEFEYLGDHYDFLIINNNDLGTESDSLIENDVFYGNRNNDSYFSAHFSYIFDDYSIKNLNNYLKALSFDGFNPNYVSYGISLALGEKNGFFSIMDILIHESMETENAREIAEFSGVTLSFAAGYDLLKSNNFLLAPRLGIGYSNYELKFYQKENNPFPLSNQFGDRKIVTYTNPAFIMDAGLDFAVQIKFMEIGVFGRYKLDGGKKQWLNSEYDIVRISPKTDLSSLMYGLRIGLAF